MWGEAGEWPYFSLPASLVTLAHSLPKDIITDCSLSWVIVPLTKMSMTVQKGGRLGTISEAANELRTCSVDSLPRKEKQRFCPFQSLYFQQCCCYQLDAREVLLPFILISGWWWSLCLQTASMAKGRCCSELQESLCRGRAHLGVALLRKAQEQSSVLLSICLKPFTYFLLSCHCLGCGPGTQLLQPYA